MISLVAFMGIVMLIVPYMVRTKELSSTDAILFIIYAMLVFIAMGIFWIVELLREIRNKW